MGTFYMYLTYPSKYAEMKICSLYSRLYTLVLLEGSSSQVWWLNYSKDWDKKIPKFKTYLGYRVSLKSV